MPVELMNSFSKMSEADVPIGDITGYATLEKVTEGVKTSNSLWKNAESLDYLTLRCLRSRR